MTTPDPKALPDEPTLEKAAKLNILNSKGAKVPFGSIFQDDKTVIIFIRHFFCGRCRSYVEHLATIPQTALEKANVKIAVVGCGEWEPISSYAESTGFLGDIYADPSRELYRTLGMNIETLSVTPAGQKKRSYLTSGFLVNTARSIWQGPLTHPSLIGKQGNINQLGGDFIFGPGIACSLAARMEHTEDHMEIADVMNAAGISLT